MPAVRENPSLEQRSEQVLSIFRDYIDRFGDFPYKKYLAVFTDKSPEGYYITGSSAHEIGFAGPVAVEYTFLAHEIFHVWNAGIIKQKSNYEGWFKEGFTQYYGYLTPYRIDLYSEDKFLEHLENDYQEYIDRYESGKDMTLSKVKEELARQEGHEHGESLRLMTMYFKGPLVAALMDREIRNITNDEKDLDDLMRKMFNKFRNRKYSSQDIMVTLNEVTGYDFTEFFSNFVYGRSKLPPITD
ncbi:hypothetical protein GF312_06400 [Candidatus Poribacteria bacterium]|nr:hypothetical protein [Candidatus Poribacteria bacterium]